MSSPLSDSALRELSPGSALELQRLLAPESPVYANTFF
jgi:hypothetical protein